MTVFKGYLKIIKQNLTYMISWIFIFLIITLMMDSFTNDAQKGIFRAESVDIAVVDLDSSTLSQGLIDYLSLHNQVTLTDGDQEKLTAALYYRTYAYVLTIPEGFGSSFPDGGETLKATKVPGSTEGYYLDTQTDSFLNQVGSQRKRSGPFRNISARDAEGFQRKRRGNAGLCLPFPFPPLPVYFGSLLLCQLYTDSFQQP